MDGFSTRGCVNLTQVLARIPPNILEPTFNHDLIDLSMAENGMIRNEMVDIVKESIVTDFEAKNYNNVSFQHLNWPKGFFGDPSLLNALANTLNVHFQPFTPIESHHIAVTAGASSGLDAILYNICNPGDGILVPCPYWGGYDAIFALHSEVHIVGVQISDLEGSLSTDLISALEEQYRTASRPIKALLLSNPHNPLGRPYTQTVLERCVAFCQRRQIHLISDEVFALSRFSSPDFKAPPPFTSCQALNLSNCGFDPYRVHVVWSVSKDLASSGVRLGCVLTRNRKLRDAVGLLASVHVSALSTVFVNSLLSSSRVASLFQLSSTRLAERYMMITTALRTAGAEYFPCSSAVFVMARLAPCAETWEDEAQAVRRYYQAGVILMPGQSYHMPENQKGWMRVTFAVDKAELAAAIQRIKKVFQELLQEGYNTRFTS